MRRWHVLTMVHFAAAVPSHSVVGLPSLSPTMVSPHAGPAPPKTLLTKASAPQTEGSISSWLVSVGEEVEPGDVFCEIETDKATVEMECQDTCAPPPPPPPPPCARPQPPRAPLLIPSCTGYIAKLLVDEGTTIATTTPIMVTVEEEEDVGAFADFVAPEAAAAAPAPAAEAPAPAAAPTPAPTPAPAAAPASPAKPVSGAWWGPQQFSD